MATLRLPATLDSLEPLRSFALDRAGAAGLATERLLKLELALEELLVNVMHYAYPQGTGDVELECTASSGSFFVAIRDWGLAFDPLTKETPDLHENIADRPIGGLGIFFVREMSDAVCYERCGDCNVLTVSFARPQ